MLKWTRTVLLMTFSLALLTGCYESNLSCTDVEHGTYDAICVSTQTSWFGRTSWEAQGCSIESARQGYPRCFGADTAPELP